MAKYLVQFSYTEDGLKRLIKDGGAKRRAAVEQLVKSMGGELLEYFYTFGEYDGMTIVEGVDEVSMVAGILAASGTGAVKTKTTVLIDPEEMDQAILKAEAFPTPLE